VTRRGLARLRGQEASATAEFERVCRTHLKGSALNAPSTDPTPPLGARLRAALQARSVAIVGASADATKITGRPLAYMLARGYSGKLYPVNPGRSEVQGQRCYPSLAAIGQPVDLAIVGTPAAQVEGVIAEGIVAGIRAFVVFSSGFAETGDAGRALQQRLRALAREAGVAIVGPNCLGLANSATGLIASFTTALEETPLERGAFGFVSQSGALGAYWMDIVLRSGIGFSQWVTTGNECDIDAAEAVACLADDPDTRIIGLYLEDIHDTQAFRIALQRAAVAGKPVIAIKSGRSQAGAAAAASHTGALAGDDALYDACLLQHGALRVGSLTEMVDVARLFLHDSVPAGPRLAVMSVSGGAGVMIADEAEARHMSVPAFDAATCAALRPALPAFTRPANPLDITGNVVQDTAGIARALHAVATDPNVDAIVLFVGMMHSIAGAFTAALSAVRAAAPRPVIVVWMSAMPETVATLEAAGISVFTDIPPAMQAIAGALRARALQAAARAAPMAAPEALALTTAPARALSEWDGKQLLRDQDAVQLPPGVLIATDAAESALPAALQYPVVAKLQSAALLHKSDAGAVILRIGNDAALADALQRLREIGTQLALDVQGVLVEQMVTFDHELLLGLRRDPRFGAVLTLARGGVEVELDADAVTRLLPVNAAQVEAMLRGLRSARLLDGYRGRPAVDIPAVAAHIATLCDWFIAQAALQEMEINPLALRGSQAWALDALASRAGD
jgi:acyl-CoA synthetase (NDP forming)